MVETIAFFTYNQLSSKTLTNPVRVGETGRGAFKNSGVVASHEVIMRIATKSRYGWGIALIVFGVTSASLAQQNTSGEVKVLAIDSQSEIRYAAPWTLAAAQYSNAKELVAVSRSDQTERVVARVLITMEPRGNHPDAIKRLQDIAGSRDEVPQFLQIGGWPAIEVKFLEAVPQRGEGEKEGDEIPADVVAQRLVTAIAADDRVVRFDASLLPDAPQGLLQGTQDLIRSVHFAKEGSPVEVQETLRRMQTEDENRRQQLRQQHRGEAPETGLTIRSAAIPAEIVGPRPPEFVQSGQGELEITTSADAFNIVVASNAGLSVSHDRGNTFTPGSTGGLGLNDPSLTRAVSGSFYLAVINGCNNSVSRSDDRGANFVLKGNSAQCPLTGTGTCFPDQEHIAADTFNAATAGDQVYAVWRNFTVSGTTCGSPVAAATTSISCSQDSGVNWTARAVVNGAGDFPRVAVGRDGTVYVATISGTKVLLNRLTSCANGLTATTGDPVTVATLTGAVDCGSKGLPGLDRCDGGNTLESPTVAPDPDDANHLYVSFAESDGAGGERIVTFESNDRGGTFGAKQSISASVSARRFMPWSCTARGDVWVGWYDRRAATTGATNDLTDYFVGSSALNEDLNLTNNSDPQCASGWPNFTRRVLSAESCTIQPQLAGHCCQPPPPGSSGSCVGSGTRCDFSGPDATVCPTSPPGQPAETCLGGSGVPKYGDYNGIACGNDFVIAAWASATSPTNLPATGGLGVFSSVINVAPNQCVPLGQQCTDAQFCCSTAGPATCRRGVCTAYTPPRTCGDPPTPPPGLPCRGGVPYVCCGAVDGWQCGRCQ